LFLYKYKTIPLNKFRNLSTLSYKVSTFPEREFFFGKFLGLKKSIFGFKLKNNLFNY